ncbi:MAG: protein phosphatase 2C domain-containing protein [Deltaproteobacteria bacterium]|jgi:protein phosphatase|nr:protein phosphatase 2C domain-containing protein [Deltaproteobacteria bacterium]
MTQATLHNESPVTLVKTLNVTSQNKRVTIAIPRLRVAQASHPGLVRTNNEDSFGWFSSRAGELLVVADGMGGHVGGDLAGKIAVDVFQRRVKAANLEDPSLILREALLAADQEVTRKATEDPNLEGMGSTLVAILFSGYLAFVIHAGDSRLYRLRNGVLELLTKDHSYVQELIDSGQLTPKEAKNFELRNVITQSLGGNVDSQSIFVKSLNCQPGDLFLLCSDGLTEPVSEDLVKSILTSKASIQAKAQNLVAAALKAGGPDNVTVQLAQIDEPKVDSTDFFDPIPDSPRRFWLIGLIIFLAILFGLGWLYVFHPSKESTSDQTDKNLSPPSVSEPTNQSVSEPVNQSVSEPKNQSVSEPIETRPDQSPATN